MCQHSSELASRGGHNDGLSFLVPHRQERIS